MKFITLAIVAINAATAAFVKIEPNLRGTVEADLDKVSPSFEGRELGGGCKNKCLKKDCNSSCKNKCINRCERKQKRSRRRIRKRSRTRELV